MNILSVSTSDLAGGAERIAQSLHASYRCAGHTSHLLVGSKKRADSDAVVIDNNRYRSLHSRLFISISDSLGLLTRGRLGRIRRAVARIGQQHRYAAIMRGEEDFDFPGTQHILDIVPDLPEVVHCHNLHGGYFDLRHLAELSSKMPVVLTLHDEWMLTGHCAYTFSCERWKTGCGQCPDLDIYPPILKDATAYNWNRKKAIYADSRLYVATPSKWLMDKVEQSILASSIAGSRVIHNGIDLDRFKPADKLAARDKLGIGRDAKVLLFAANGMIDNRFKDFATLSAAVERIASRLPSTDVQFVALGETAKQRRIGAATITFVPFSDDIDFIAAHYQAADVYLHAANSDNFPTTILEALACGTPVVATAVGGIPEQVEHGVTGYLVPPKDHTGIADGVCSLLADSSRLAAMSHAAAECAKQHFDLKAMATEYINWYSEIITSRLSPQQH